MNDKSKQPRTCLQCGVNIDHKRPQAKFCSKDCSQEYYKEVNRDKYKAAKQQKIIPPTKVNTEAPPPPVDILDDLISVSEVKKILNVQKQTLYKWRKEGLITLYAITPRKQYARRSEIVKLLKEVQ